MEKSVISLNPVEATPQIMQMLEDKGLIIRLIPGRHAVKPPLGEGGGGDIYISDPKFGSHMLINVTNNIPEFKYFGYHPDNEEFLLLGEPDTKPLFLAIALMNKDELNRKISDKTLCNDDFIMLNCRFNDPYCSFFVMKGCIPHGEATTADDKTPPTFYVTEPSDMGLVKTDLGDYSFSLCY